MPAERGFTLLEILAALAIAVIGIMAVAKTTHSAVGLLQATEDRVLASWVASNRLAELRITRAWPSPVSKDFSSEQGGRVWYVREEVSTTADPDLLRIDLTVYRDQDYQHSGASVFGYLARYSPPSTPPDESAPAADQSAEQSEGGNESVAVPEEAALEAGSPAWNAAQ